MATTTENNTSILMFPWLAYGHISPFFELAKKLSVRKFHVYFCSIPINLKSIRDNDFPSSIQLIHSSATATFIPATPTSLPHNERPPSPSYVYLVIFDFLQHWVPEVAMERHLQAVTFLAIGAATSSYLSHYCKYPTIKFPFQERDFTENEARRLTELIHDMSDGVSNGERFIKSMRKSSNMILVKTTREIEARYLDYLSVLTGNKEMVTIGTLMQEPAQSDSSGSDDTYIMNCLNQQIPCSVVHVSFGSEYFLSMEETHDISHALELSRAKFVWLVRFHGGEDKLAVEEIVTQGFLERVGDSGLVVQGWAPQAKILRHRSTGGFVSHCGWSSTLAVSFKLPIIAMPMQLDQPINAKLVVELGVGMEVLRKNGIIDREELVKVIREFAVEEEKNYQTIRRRAENWRKTRFTC
ncbi:hypothetical protein K2173_021033 [Erythroxylum novogranatense]|uniref:Glycosyltransferase n=1 Tax=Erythroxylum novogranatense TaxID=1862640 RepID=A0AAV8TQH2_9ROSI|nr:hypothetical protein K2173_021033 [Erythroxylum novogranatense]